jgi:hypothetical protein
MLARMSGKTERAHHAKRAAHFGDAMPSEFALFISLGTAARFWQQDGRSGRPLSHCSLVRGRLETAAPWR